MEAEEDPVLLGNITMNEKMAEKYLGDILHSQGLSASVQATIKAREAKTRGSIYELRSLTEDFRMQSVGACQSALDLYETCIIPSLLSNAGTWVEISDESVKLLDKIQDTFGKVLLSLPASAQSARISVGSQDIPNPGHKEARRRRACKGGIE